MPEPRNVITYGRQGRGCFRVRLWHDTGDWNDLGRTISEKTVRTIKQAVDVASNWAILYDVRDWDEKKMRLYFSD